PLDFGPQDDLAQDDALALALACVVQLLLGATEGVLGGPPQGFGPEDGVIRNRDFVGHRLEGATRLELGDVAGQPRLLVPSQPTAEVEEQPLNLQLGQLEGRPDVKAKRHRPQAGYEVESRETLPDPDRFARHPEGEHTRIVTGSD